MADPKKLDLTAYRWATFLHVIFFDTLDLVDAAFALQVRQYQDQPGDALISLAMADSSAQGLSVNPSGDSFVLTIRINEITINGTLPFTVVDGFANRAPGLDVNLVYDLVATDADGMKHRLHEGEFVIKPGVTRSS